MVMLLPKDRRLLYAYILANVIFLFMILLSAMGLDMGNQEIQANCSNSTNTCIEYYLSKEAYYIVGKTGAIISIPFFITVVGLFWWAVRQWKKIEAESRASFQKFNTTLFDDRITTHDRMALYEETVDLHPISSCLIYYIGLVFLGFIIVSCISLSAPTMITAKLTPSQITFLPHNDRLLVLIFGTALLITLMIVYFDQYNVALPISIKISENLILIACTQKNMAVLSAEEISLLSGVSLQSVLAFFTKHRILQGNSNNLLHYQQKQYLAYLGYWDEIEKAFHFSHKSKQRWMVEKFIASVSCIVALWSQYAPYVIEVLTRMEGS